MSSAFDVGQHCQSCDAQTIWAETEKGRRMLVDAEPAPAGTVLLLLSRTAQAPLARIVKAELAFGRTDLRLAHFATCPEAGAHRRKRGRS